MSNDTSAIVAFGNAYYARLLANFLVEEVRKDPERGAMIAMGRASHTARLVEAIERGDHLRDHAAVLDKLLPPPEPEL